MVLIKNYTLRRLPLRLSLLITRTTSQEFGTGLSNITKKFIPPPFLSHFKVRKGQRWGLIKESLPNRYSALQLAHVCACVTGLQHSALYRFGRFARMLCVGLNGVFGGSLIHACAGSYILRNGQVAYPEISVKAHIKTRSKKRGQCTFFLLSLTNALTNQI